MTTTLTMNADQLARKYASGVSSLDELVQKQRLHHYIPTIRLDVGTRTERAERAALAGAYNLAAQQQGLDGCFH